MSKNVLTTGGGGFIGSHVADELLERGCRVRALDNLSVQVHGREASRPNYLHPDVEWHLGDVCDAQAVRKALEGIDQVIHLAAVVGVGQSMYEVVHYSQTNVVGTAVLMEELIRRPVERLVVASSMSIYGEGLYRDADGALHTQAQRDPARTQADQWEPLDAAGRPMEPLPTPETKTPNLASVYALTKYDQERMCLTLGGAYAIPTVALRFFNTYGPRQALSNPYTGVLAIFASRLLNDNPPLIFEDGHQQRDFVSVHDVARACALALEAPEAPGHVFNVASGQRITVREVADRIAATVVQPGQIELREVPLPQPGPGQIRVRLEGCGVCASNLPPWQGREWFSYPFEPGQPGHEGWGVVDAVGPDLTDLQPGQRVSFLSDHAYAAYDVTDAQKAVPLPDALAGRPFPGEPLGCGMNVFERSRIGAGQTVAIVGIGFLGALLTQLAAGAGARVLAISRRPFSLQVARSAGADETIAMEDHWRILEQVKGLTGGRMCGVVIEAIGQQWPLDLAGELTGERGRLVVAGYHQDGPRQVNMQLWNWRGLDVINAHERAVERYTDGIRRAIAAVQAGRLQPGLLLTHTYPLSRLDEALNATAERPACHVVDRLALALAARAQVLPKPTDCHPWASGRAVPDPAQRIRRSASETVWPQAKAGAVAAPSAATSFP